MCDRQTRSLLALFVVLGAGPGCSLINDLDRFEQVDGGSGEKDAAPSKSIGCDDPATLCVRLNDFDGHPDQLIVVDLVTETGDLRARAVLDPAAEAAATQEIVMPLAVPADEVPDGTGDHLLHLQAWADVDGDREYDKGKDLGWIAPLDTDKSHGEITRDDAASIELDEPTPIGDDFEMKATGFTIHGGADTKGKQFELMLIEAASGRSVGLFRLAHVPASGAFDALIPGVVQSEGGGGTVYTIEFYADADNSNGHYDGFPKDHSWIITRESDDKGLSIDRTHSRPSGVSPSEDPSFDFKQLEYQFRFEE